MFKFPKLFASAILALSLCGGAGLALAGPVYHVTLDTSSYSGTSGNIDFTLLAPTGALGASVTVSNFNGSLGPVSTAIGAVTGTLPGPVTLTNNDGTNDLFQSVNFANSISFDLLFLGDFLSTAGFDASTFAIALFNDAGDAYLGGGNLVEFALTPSFNGVAADVSYKILNPLADASLAAPAAVPEPSELLLMMTGLGLIGFLVRRRTVRAA